MGKPKQRRLGCFVDNFIKSIIAIISAPLWEVEFSVLGGDAFLSMHLSFLYIYHHHLIIHTVNFRKFVFC